MTRPAAKPDLPAMGKATASPSFGRLVATLSSLIAFASISTDLYLPALPTLGRALGGTQGSVELTLSSFLIGFSLGQLFWGPIGDRLGRRGPILAGLALFAIGSAGCALATDIVQLIGWRVVQALGACAGPVLARAMARDLYGGNKAAQLLSTLMLVMGVAPLLGPLIGGQLLAIGSWRLIFWLQVGLALAVAIAVRLLPETLPPERRTRHGWRAVFAGYGLMLRSPVVMGYAVASGCYYGGIYAYLAGTPFAYISYYHVPAQAYGFLFATGIVGQMALNLVNTRHVIQQGSERMLMWGAALIGGSGLWTGFAAATGIGGLLGLALPLFLFISANGLFIANAVSGALSVHPERAGVVSALVGAIQFGSGILGSALVGWFADGTPRPMGLVIAGLGIASFVVTMLTVRRVERTSPPREASRG